MAFPTTFCKMGTWYSQNNDNNEVSSPSRSPVRPTLAELTIQVLAQENATLRARGELQLHGVAVPKQRPKTPAPPTGADTPAARRS